MTDINIILAERQEQKKIVANKLYTIAFILYTVLNIVTASMLKHSLPEGMMGSISSLSMLIMALLLVTKLFFYSTTDFKSLFIKGLMLFVSLIAYPIYGPPIFITTLFVVTADDVNFRELIKRVVKIDAICIVIIMLLAKLNIIEDLIYQRGNRTRDSFGFTYVTVFASKVFYTVAAYLYIRGKKINYKDVLGVLAIVFFIYHFCYARLSAYSMIILLVMVLIAKYLPKLLINKWLRIPILNLYWILAGAIYWLSSTYHENAFYDKVNHLLSGRLKLGNIALQKYDVPILGQYIAQKGNGGSTTPVPAHEYFFIDSSYLRLLLMYGLVIFILFGIIFYLNFRRAYQMKDSYFIAILCVILITGLIDEHLISPINIFMIGMLSLTEDSVDKELEKNNEKQKIGDYIKKQFAKEEI